MTQQKPGTGLEAAVARIQAMLDPNWKVSKNEWLLDRLGMEAQRVCKKKKRWVLLHGNAFYDWQTGAITIPAGPVDRS